MPPLRRPRPSRPRGTRAPAVPVLTVVVLAAGTVVGLNGCADSPERVTQNAVIQPGRPGEDATTLLPGTELRPTQDSCTGATSPSWCGRSPTTSRRW